MRENLAAILKLLLVTDDTLLAGAGAGAGADALALCRAAVLGGVTAVELRLKRATDHDLVALARRLVTELAVPVLVNDRLDVALAAGAAGVHLGPNDLSPELARRIVPPDFVIGASVGAPEEIARGASADYWGIGPLHATVTKVDAGPALGIVGATRLLDAAKGRPCVLIGGVRPEDVMAARTAGFAGIAVASGILASADVAEAARLYAL